MKRRLPKRTPLWHLVGALLLALLSIGLASGSATAAPVVAADQGKAPVATGGSSSSDCNGGWEIVASPNVGNEHNTLNAIVAVSANDIWAVGSQLSCHMNECDPYQVLIEHWDGTQWSVFPSPQIGGNDTSVRLNAIDAVSATDIWAVGEVYSLNSQQPFAMHWNGMIWNTVPMSTTGGIDAMLSTVAAISADDVWAGGAKLGAALTMHWDGTTWSEISNPMYYISEIAAVSSGEVWAVGVGASSSSPWGSALIMRWDGVAWHAVPGPPSAHLPGAQTWLESITALSSNDIWAVGGFTYDSYRFIPITIHWDGSHWSEVPSAARGVRTFLYDIEAVSTNDVWAVGYDEEMQGHHPMTTFIMRWDGTAWNEVPSANGDDVRNNLWGIDVAGNDIWAVGVFGNATPIYPEQTLVERLTRSCASPATK